MKTIQIFHPTIAPYRIDFFNRLFEAEDVEINLYYENLKDQIFDYEKIREQFSFEPYYMQKAGKILGRTIYKNHIKKIINGEKDIVITSEYSFGTWCAVLGRLFSKKKYAIISICDDSLQIAKSCHGVRKLSRHFLMKNINGLILCNDQVGEWYKKQYGIENFVFPIIQDEIVFRKRLMKSIPLAKDILEKNNLYGKKIFLFVGRIVKEKNVDYLVKSFVEFHKKNSEAVLIIIGDGGTGTNSILEVVKKIVEVNCAHKYILLLGRKEGEELLAYYNIGQILVLPSVYEPFGAVVNEALLAGEYVMVSQNAGASCLIDENNGEIIDISSKYIAFDEMNGRIRTLDESVQMKGSKMNIQFNVLFEELLQWLRMVSSSDNIS